jgi:hypothetical protein
MRRLLHLTLSPTLQLSARALPIQTQLPTGTKAAADRASSGLTMISTDAMDSMLAKGNLALGSREGRTVTTMAEIITANWKKRVHLLQHMLASMQPWF